MGQYNIEIKKLTAYGSFGSVEIIAMLRNRYSITYVHNGIDEISFKMDAEPGAKVFIQGVYAENGVSPSYPLNCGRNVFQFELISEDGKERRNVEAKVYRAYPSPVWKKVIDHAPWRPRDSAGELVFNDRIWLFGGYVPETVPEVWSTSDGIEWKQHPDIPSPVGVDIPVALNYKGKMFVFDVAGVLYSSKDGDHWDIVNANSPFLGRRHMGGYVFKDKMWVMGGVNNKELFNDVWSSEDGVNWTLETEHAPWCKRMIHTTTLVYDNKMWLFGGGVLGSSYFPFVAYNDVWCSEDGVNWERKIANAPWVPRVWGSVAVYKNRMWVLAGYRSEPESRHFGDAWYSTDGVEWIEFKQHASEWKKESGTNPISIMAPTWQDRHETSVIVYNDTMYLMGGMIWPLLNDVWKLKIDGLCFLTQPRFEGYVDCLYEYHAFADFSKSGQKAKYRLVNAPAWLSIDVKTGKLEGISEEPFHAPVVIEAYDDFGETARQEFVLNIAPLE